MGGSRDGLDLCIFAKQLDRVMEGQLSLEERLKHCCRLGIGRVSLSTSLGMEDQAILHEICESDLDIDIFTLDTGRLFSEGLQLLADSEQRYRVKIRVYVPDQEDVERLIAQDGILGFTTSIDARKRCCDVRKVRPLKRALREVVIWISGLRRAQSEARTSVPFAVFDEQLDLIKVHPIADWSDEQLAHYIADNKVLTSSLHERGYPSVGCQPCTRSIKFGESKRAGRWWWEKEESKECGLHVGPRRVRS